MRNASVTIAKTNKKEKYFKINFKRYVENLHKESTQMLRDP